MITVDQMDHPVYVKDNRKNINRRRKRSTVTMCV